EIYRPTPRTEFRTPVPAGPTRYMGPPSNYPQERSRPTCYKCKQPGHLMASFPLNNNYPARNYNSPSTGNNRPAQAFCLEQDSPLEEYLGPLHEANPVYAASDNRQHHRQE
ncbi:---NA---, partial [Pelobates cultripes]